MTFTGTGTEADPYVPIDPVDQAAANAVIAKINAIGTVVRTTACKTKIDDARTAYNALTDVQKTLVTNYATLTSAEAAYSELETLQSITVVWDGSILEEDNINSAIKYQQI